MKIKVKPEGRDGMYLPDIDSLVEWIKSKKFKYIHHAYAGGSMIIGADWNPEDAIERIRAGERVAILTKEVAGSNMGHAIAVVHKNKLNILDVGPITKDNLIVEKE